MHIREKRRRRREAKHRTAHPVAAAGPPLEGRLVVVSAIFGGRDSARAIPAAVDVDEFVMFTDCYREVAGWRVVSFDKVADPRMAARRVKTLALEMVEADTVVWIDGRIELTGEPLRPMLTAALEGVDIAGFPHPWRRCAYAEAQECARLGLATQAAIDKQMTAYRFAGLPPEAGLWNTMVLARRNTPAMRALGRDWLEELENHTPRDQVSLPFLLWDGRVDCGLLGADVYRKGNSAHFVRGSHT